MPTLGILHHQDSECSFPDGGYRESTAYMDKPGSKPTVLLPVHHPTLEEAALFRCSWCRGEFLAGTVHRSEYVRRAQEVKQRSRRFTRQALISAGIIFGLFVIVGVLLWGWSGVALYFFIGIPVTMALLGMLLPRGKYTVTTAVINAKTGTASDKTHFLKLVR